MLLGQPGTHRRSLGCVRSSVAASAAPAFRRAPPVPAAAAVYRRHSSNSSRSGHVAGAQRRRLFGEGGGTLDSGSGSSSDEDSSSPDMPPPQQQQQQQPPQQQQSAAAAAEAERVRKRQEALRRLEASNARLKLQKKLAESGSATGSSLIDASLQQMFAKRVADDAADILSSAPSTLRRQLAEEGADLEADWSEAEAAGAAGLTTTGRAKSLAARGRSTSDLMRPLVRPQTSPYDYSSSSYDSYDDYEHDDEWKEILDEEDIPYWEGGDSSSRDADPAAAGAAAIRRQMNDPAFLAWLKQQEQERAAKEARAAREAQLARQLEAARGPAADRLRKQQTAAELARLQSKLQQQSQGLNRPAMRPPQRSPGAAGGSGSGFEEDAATDPADVRKSDIGLTPSELAAFLDELDSTSSSSSSSSSSGVPVFTPKPGYTFSSQGRALSSKLADAGASGQLPAPMLVRPAFKPAGPAGSNPLLDQPQFWDEEEAAAAAAAQEQAARKALILDLLAEQQAAEQAQKQQQQQRQSQLRQQQLDQGLAITPAARAAAERAQKAFYNAQLNRPSRPGVSSSPPSFSTGRQGAFPQQQQQQQRSALEGLQRPARPGQQQQGQADDVDADAAAAWDAEEAAVAAVAAKEAARLELLAQLQAEVEAAEAAGVGTAAASKQRSKPARAPPAVSSSQTAKPAPLKGLKRPAARPGAGQQLPPLQPQQQQDVEGVSGDDDATTAWDAQEAAAAVAASKEAARRELLAQLQAEAEAAEAAAQAAAAGKTKQRSKPASKAATSAVSSPTQPTPALQGLKKPAARPSQQQPQGAKAAPAAPAAAAKPKQPTLARPSRPQASSGNTAAAAQQQQQQQPEVWDQQEAAAAKAAAAEARRLELLQQLAEEAAAAEAAGKADTAAVSTKSSSSKSSSKMQQTGGASSAVQDRKLDAQGLKKPPQRTAFPQQSGAAAAGEKQSKQKQKPKQQQPAKKQPQQQDRSAAAAATAAAAAAAVAAAEKATAAITAAAEAAADVVQQQQQKPQPPAVDREALRLKLEQQAAQAAAAAQAVGPQLQRPARPPQPAAAAARGQDTISSNSSSRAPSLSSLSSSLSRDGKRQRQEMPLQRPQLLAPEATSKAAASTTADEAVDWRFAAAAAAATGDSGSSSSKAGGTSASQRPVREKLPRTVPQDKMELAAHLELTRTPTPAVIRGVATNPRGGLSLVLQLEQLGCVTLMPFSQLLPSQQVQLFHEMGLPVPNFVFAGEQFKSTGWELAGVAQLFLQGWRGRKLDVIIATITRPAYAASAATDRQSGALPQLRRVPDAFWTRLLKLALELDGSSGADDLPDADAGVVADSIAAMVRDRLQEQRSASLFPQQVTVGSVRRAVAELAAAGKLPDEAAAYLLVPQQADGGKYARCVAVATWPPAWLTQQQQQQQGQDEGVTHVPGSVGATGSSSSSAEGRVVGLTDAGQLVGPRDGDQPAYSRAQVALWQECAATTTSSSSSSSDASEADRPVAAKVVGVHPKGYLLCEVLRSSGYYRRTPAVEAALVAVPLSLCPPSMRLGWDSHHHQQQQQLNKPPQDVSEAVSETVGFLFDGPGEHWDHLQLKVFAGGPDTDRFGLRLFNASTSPRWEPWELVKQQQEEREEGLTAAAASDTGSPAGNGGVSGASELQAWRQGVLGLWRQTHLKVVIELLPLEQQQDAGALSRAVEAAPAQETLQQQLQGDADGGRGRDKLAVGNSFGDAPNLALLARILERIEAAEKSWFSQAFRRLSE